MKLVDQVAEDLLLIVDLVLRVVKELRDKEMMEELVILLVQLVPLIEPVVAVVVLVVRVLMDLILVGVMVEMVRHTLVLLDLYFQRCQQVGRML